MGGFFPKPRQDRLDRGDKEGDGSDTRGANGSDKKDQGGNKGGPKDDLEDWIKDLGNRELAYFLAGIIGINPAKLTLRKLLLMSDGKERSDWNKFSVLISTIHNVNCTKKSDMIDFKNIHPYYVSEAIEKRKAGPSKEEIAHGLMQLKKAFNG